MIAAAAPTHYEWTRLAVFGTVLLAVCLWEIAQPWRGGQHRLRRWPGNFGIVVVDALLARLVMPATAAGVALACQTQGIGLFNRIGAPDWLVLIAALILLDLAIYGQHVLFHKVPALWRLHRMHHADTVLDVSSGLRFHPFEILLSLLIKFAVIAAIGAPPAAVLLFEIILNATAMFNHANVRLSAGVDRLLRLLVVTPDMHRIHHSVERRETDSNYGFNLPWWDRLFGTYRNEPAAGRDSLVIGLAEFRAPEESRLDRMLTQPFRAGKREINEKSAK